MAKPLAVLIVEDSESDAQLIVRLLTKAGYTVTSKRVETDEQLRVALDKQAWEVLISDYSLPELDGLTALELLQETGLDLPFVVVSGTMGEETAVAMMRAGAHDYLLKGNLARLVPVVERELKQAEVRRKRRQAESALSKSEEKFREVFESANVGKSITLPTGEISVNNAFAEWLGYSREELANKTWQELTPPEEIESIQAILAPLLCGEKDTARFEKRYIHKNGPFIWADVSTALRRCEDSKPLYFITTVVDITARKQGEEALRNKIDELQRFQRLTVGRELKMIELKKEINSLLKQAGEPAKYRIDADL
jgi:PAS domain S-box-containing protein